jgi:hypothetical protein
MSANIHRMTGFVESMFAQIGAIDKTGPGDWWWPFAKP